MFGISKISFDQKRLVRLTDSRNIVLYIFLLVVLGITWSGVKTLQSNYELQKKISELKQENSVLVLQNQNTALQNNYYQTSEYLDLSARQNLGLAAPGEKVLLISKNTALKYVNQSVVPPKTGSVDNRSTAVKNIEAWRDFLLGRKSVGS